MTITWPLTLPQSFLVESFAEEAPDNIIRSAMDSGPSKARKRYSATVTPFSGHMIMTQAQYLIFKDFFRNTISDGAFSFQMTDYVNGGTMEVRFRDKPTANFLGTVWDISFGLDKQP